MSDPSSPAVALAAVPGRRRASLDLAREIERRGFSGIYCASFGDALGLCEALALATERIPLGTSIANLYTRHVSEYAVTASLVHELSGGRFHFGVGVSHDPMNRRLGIDAGRPLSDMRRFVEQLREVPRAGELPPIVVAALREKMVALAGEIGEGVVFANAARSHMTASLAALPDSKAAMERNRRTLVMYVSLPNYRNYWKEAGYVEEMEAIEDALAKGDRDSLPGLMSDRWLADVTLFGSVSEVRDGVAAWRLAGVRTPILVPSSATGNQMKAFEELFAAFPSPA
jgi:alkanesulfonate monooxygenase SsuD/methylene tetrahydromethanopterin reductase-like flavin-dependent oxidoreductase (luciferase family)